MYAVAWLGGGIASGGFLGWLIWIVAYRSWPAGTEEQRLGILAKDRAEALICRPGAEVTLEANPTSVEAARFKGYRAAGVNRVSLGVQALDHAAVELYPNVAPITRNGYVYTPMSAVLHRAGVTITIKRPKGYKGNARTLFLLPPDAFAIIRAADALNADTTLTTTAARIEEARALLQSYGVPAEDAVLAVHDVVQLAALRPPPPPPVPHNLPVVSTVSRRDEPAS